MILITGATGNVGLPLVTQLLARGAKVRAVSRHPTLAGRAEPKLSRRTQVSRTL